MPTMADITGPVTEGTKGWPFGRPNVDLGAYGYREDEFFLEGTAERYRPRPGTELSRDGHWQVEPAESTPYKTRFVVYRPVDPQAFNGTVLVSWNNVSAGLRRLQRGQPEILESGFAYVAVTAQRAGVHGMGESPMGLRAWDPQRYGTLSIPSDDYSYDIFTQRGAPSQPTGLGRPLILSAGSACNTSSASADRSLLADSPPISTLSSPSRGCSTPSCRLSTSVVVPPWRSASTCSTRRQAGLGKACPACRACSGTSTRW